MENRLLRIVFFLMVPFIFVKQSNAQEEKFKAIFIYNFTKYIDWPMNSKSDFIIAIIGKSPLEGELKNIAAKMKVGNKTIVVKSFLSVNEVDNAQMIYIADRKADLASIVAKSKTLNCLLISNSTNSCQQGAGINFILKNGNLGFEISEKNIKMCGLQVNSSLMALGTSVE